MDDANYKRLVSFISSNARSYVETVYNKLSRSNVRTNNKIDKLTDDVQALADSVSACYVLLELMDNKLDLIMEAQKNVGTTTQSIQTEVT